MAAPTYGASAYERPEFALGSLHRRLAAIVPRRQRATTRASKTRARAAAGSGQPAPAKAAASAGSVAVLVVEVLGSLTMWAPIPLAWIWVAARVFDATASLVAAGSVALLGLAATEGIAVKALTRIDMVWLALRRRTGHDHAQGALTRVVVVSATLGLIAFFVWYYLLSHAFIIPFMPST